MDYENSNYTDEIVEKRSAVLKITKAEYIRRCIEEEAKINPYKDELDFITQVIRISITDVMTGFIERIASINAISSIASVTATYISGLCISGLIHPNRQKDIDYIIEKASKSAGAYLKSKDPELNLASFIGGKKVE